jgi:hypothetical protein
MSGPASVPHFIGIGAARAGTTWISENLQRHPGVWIPRRKELHYFTRGLHYPSPSYLADDSAFRRLIGLQDHNRLYKRNLFRALGSNLLHPSPSQLLWDLRYYLRHIDDEWYCSLFASKGEKVVGEITPAYSLLSEADAGHLVSLLPHVKIIHIMRNPSERAWSTIRYHEKRYGARLTAGSDKEIADYLSNPSIVLRSNYPKVLALWRRLLPPDQFFVCFYDEIVEAPADLLRRLLAFLGLPVLASMFSEQELKAQINPSFDKAMPAAIRRFLAQQYVEEVETLSTMIDGYPAIWLQDLRQALEREPS